MSSNTKISDAALPAIGEPAPDFELLDQHGTPVRLSSFRGRTRVVVMFYPWSFSRVCTGELCVLRDDLGLLTDLDAQLLAISVDSKYVQRTFAEREGFTFPLLADFWPHGEVARRYGIFDGVAGAALRGTFIVDREGVLRWSIVRGIPDPRDAQQYRDVLASLD
ncbi:MAG TPA: peroxiredoxin [Acidothermaceae bacterium]